MCYFSDILEKIVLREEKVEYWKEEVDILFDTIFLLLVFFFDTKVLLFVVLEHEEYQRNKNKKFLVGFAFF